MFNFSLDEINTLRGYLHSIFKRTENELEIRFSYIKDDWRKAKTFLKADEKPNDFRFVPVIEQNVFYRSLKTFESYNLQREKSFTVDYIYEDYIRKTVLYGENETKKLNPLSESWITKTKNRNFDIWNGNVRFSLSNEIPCNPIQNQKIEPNLVRRKERTSFYDGCARFDFTIVTSTSKTRPEQKTTFEIEVEFVQPSQDIPEKLLSNVVREFCDKLISCSVHLLQVLHDSPAIITTVDRRNIPIEYSVLCKTDHLPRSRFIGAQPETLHKYHLQKLKNCSLSEKYDGERYLLFCSDTSEVFIISRNLEIKSTGLFTNEFKGTVLDVEVCNRDIHVFDILFLNGKDLRNDTNYLLKKRLEEKSKVVFHLQQNNPPSPTCFRIFDKYHHDNFEIPMKNWKEKLHLDGIPRDGFVFTPFDEPYPSKPKWMTQLKWKEVDTIDFQVKVKNQSENSITFNLFVGEKERKTVLFEPSSTMIVEKSILNVPEICGDGNFEQLSDACLECAWDYDKKSFQPIRKRVDKPFPNFISVALNIWESIKDPVRIDDFEKKKSLNLLRTFHNQIKSKVIRKGIHELEEYSKSRKGTKSKSTTEILEKKELHVLDFACGRGGDLWKWSNHGYDVIFDGVDINKEYLDEAIKRSKEVTGKCDKNFTCEFHQRDLRFDKFEQSSRKYDIVSCQFALHYFFETNDTFDNFLENVKKNLKNDGIFIASMFDGFSTFELCKKGYNKQYDNVHGFEIEPKFDPRMGLCNIKPREFSIAASAVLLGDDEVILKEPTIEYLVFCDDFVKRMRLNNMRLIETHLFSDIKFSEIDDKNVRKESVKFSDLSDIEQAYSRLHRYYIFKKDIELESETFWTDVNLKNVNKVYGENEKFENKWKLRDCESSVSACVSRYFCFHSYMEIISGKITNEENMRKEDRMLDFQKASEDYNMFIGIIETNDEKLIDFSKSVIYKPLEYLEDVKTVWLVDVISTDDKKYHNHLRLLSRKDLESEQMLLVFPPLPSAFENNDSSKNDDKTVEKNDVNVTDEFKILSLDESRKINEKSVDKWTVKDLQNFAKVENVKIPSSIRKKQDIFDFILEKTLNARVQEMRV